jgi:hypothetical protein
MSESREIALIEKEVDTGRLETNVDDLEIFVDEKLLEYTPENYKGDADSAKKDRATLNASKKTVSAKRIDIIKRAFARFGIDTFEEKCKRVEKKIDSASLALDAIVKVKEDEERSIKRAQIEQFWSVQNFDLVKLDKIFDQKWLNKTAKNKDIFEEIEKKISDIYDGIKTIEAFGVDVDTLKPIFLETLDIGATIQQGNRLRENRERLAKEEAERKERESLKAKQVAQKELASESIQEQKNEPIASIAAQAIGEVFDNDPEMTYLMRFKGKKSVLFALRQYMIDNNITYEKIEE